MTQDTIETLTKYVRKCLNVSKNDVAYIYDETEATLDEKAALAKIIISVDELLLMFKQEKLASVIRRSAPLFNDESALDWMLRGEIARVVELYKQNLFYQP